MKRLAPWLLALLLAFGMFVFAPACTSGGDDDTDDDIDDDTDDDTADDDTEDYCDTLTEEELNLFRTIFCAGSSNSWSDDFGTPPYTKEDLSTWYHGKIAIKAMEKLAECVEYEPVLWVYWYTDVELVPKDTTLSWAVDALFHFLDDNPDAETFRQRTEDYLDTLFSGMGKDGVYFIGANIPKAMLFDYTGDQDAILQVIYEEFEERPYAVMVDLDYYMTQLIAGNVYYNGQKLGPFDILKDLLHVNELGHQLLADIWIGVINEIWPNLDIPTWGEIEIQE